jgi:hypothetical protein
MKQKNGSNFLRLRCQKFFISPTIYLLPMKGWEQKAGRWHTVPEIGDGFQFGNRSYDFRRFIVLWLGMAGNKIIKIH